MHRKKTEWWPRCSGEGTLVFNGERAPVREDKKSSEDDGDEGYTTQMLMPLKCTLTRWSKWYILYYAYFTI